MEKVFKNSSMLLISQAAVKVISFFYTLFLAKNLGVSDFGLYIAALSYFSLVTSISDFGISRYLIREVVRGEKSSTDLISHILMLRVTGVSILFAVFALILYFTDPLQMRVALSLIAVLAVIPQAIALTFDNMFIAFQKMSKSAIGFFSLSIATTLAGVFLVMSGKGVVGAAEALLIGESLYALSLFYLLSKEKIPFTKKLEFRFIKEILAGSLPYGVLGVLGLIYFKIDSLFLSYMSGSFQTGLYGIAYKFLEASVFIPTAVGTAFFPVLARLHSANPIEVKSSVFKIFKSMSILGVAVLAGYLLVLPLIIRFFLPQYSEAIPALQILSFSIPFMFIHVPLSQVLLSSDKYLRGVIFLSVLTVSFNIILNFIFIPQFGYIGASWVTVVSDIFSLFMVTLFVKRYIFPK